mgnify:CR=1 FL=1
MNKFFVLLVTAMPGLQKLIIFILSERLLSVSALGEFSSDYSILLVLSFLNSVGWAGLIMVRVPKLQSMDEHRYLFKVLETCTAYYLLSLGIIFILHHYGMITDLINAALYSFAWMIYQIVRHYRLAKGDYGRILISDIVILIIFTVLMAIIQRPLLSLFVSTFVAALLLIVKPLIIERKLISWTDQIKSLEISVNNILNAAILMSLPFIANIGGEVEIGALIGYFLPFFTMSLLLSRGISLFYIPHLASSSGMALSILFKKFNVLNFIIVIVVIVLTYLLFMLLKPYLGFLSFDVLGRANLIVGLVLAVTVGALSMPASSFLLAKEYTSELLQSSVVQFLVCSIGVALYYVNHISMEALVFIIFAGGIIKVILTQFIVYRVLNKLKLDGVA